MRVMKRLLLHKHGKSAHLKALKNHGVIVVCGAAIGSF
jgi:hypothetical protein